MIKTNLYYVHDPMCSWCYAFNETFKEVKKELPANINIIYVAGGLAPHTNEPMPQSLQINIQNIWHDIEKRVGTKFNHDFWSNNIPKRSTYLSCKASIAARMQGKEEEMIDAIQEAYYLKALNPSDEEVLVNIAKDIALDVDKFKKDLNSQEIISMFNEDLEKRSKLRVNGFPSLVLQYKKELYPISINFNEPDKILEQIKDLSTNIYF